MILFEEESLVLANGQSGKALGPATQGGKVTKFLVINQINNC